MITYTKGQKFIIQQVIQEIKCIEKHFSNEVKIWTNQKRIIRLLIIAEAPLSCDRYFYNRIRGNFLQSLKTYYAVPQNSILDKLRVEGIFVVDMYELPIPTKYYDLDSKTHNLFDANYFGKKIRILGNAGLLTNETHAVFRYKKLIDRYLNMEKKEINTKCLKQFTYLLDSKQNPCSLNSVERPVQILSIHVKTYLNK